jgi:hypothetical protein
MYFQSFFSKTFKSPTESEPLRADQTQYQWQGTVLTPQVLICDSITYGVVAISLLSSDKILPRDGGHLSFRCKIETVGGRYKWNSCVWWC